MSSTASGLSPALLSRLDHIIFATPDLDLGIDTLEKSLGIRATRGGQHPGHGTRNAFIGLQGERFLEILGPDPDQPSPKRARWLSIDTLQEPRLTGWAAKGQDLQMLADGAARQGVNLGEVLSGRRTNKDGSVLSWNFTDPYTRLVDGIVPFFIDWGDTPHPSRVAAPGASSTTCGPSTPNPRPFRPCSVCSVSSWRFALVPNRLSLSISRVGMDAFSSGRRIVLTSASGTLAPDVHGATHVAKRLET